MNTRPGGATRRLPRVLSLLLIAGLPIMASGHAAKAAEDAHLQHQAAADASPAGYSRTEVNYRVPDVTLIRQDGVKVSLPKELDDGRPVLVNFVFTSCTTICPMLSHTLQQFQKQLGKDVQKLHMVSISIDPENDSLAKLKAYAAKFKAGPQWQHYTGTREDSIAVQQAFDAYRGDKMNHTPLFLFRAAPGKPWVRLDGIISPKALVEEYRRAMAS